MAVDSLMETCTQLHKANFYHCFSHSSFALQERKVAVDSLMEAANQLQKAHHAFADKLMGRIDVPEHHSVDQFFQTVKAAADVQVCTSMYRLIEKDACAH